MNHTLRTTIVSAVAAASLLLPVLGTAQTGGAAGGAGAAGAGTATGTMTGNSSGAQAPMTAGPGASEKTDTRAGSLSLHHTDRRFLARAHADGLAEIEFGRLAQQKASSDAVRQFAQRMIDEHTKTNEQLRSLAQTKGAVLTNKMDPAHQARRAAMEKLSGDAFDRAYVQGQIRDHRGTVQRFEGQAGGGRDAELKKFAADALPALREHLQMARGLAR